MILRLNFWGYTRIYDFKSWLTSNMHVYIVLTHMTGCHNACGKWFWIHCNLPFCIFSLFMSLIPVDSFAYLFKLIFNMGLEVLNSLHASLMHIHWCINWCKSGTANINIEWMGLLIDTFRIRWNRVTSISSDTYQLHISIGGSIYVASHNKLGLGNDIEKILNSEQRIGIGNSMNPVNIGKFYLHPQNRRDFYFCLNSLQHKETWNISHI